MSSIQDRLDLMNAYTSNDYFFIVETDGKISITNLEHYAQQHTHLKIEHDLQKARHIFNVLISDLFTHQFPVWQQFNTSELLNYFLLYATQLARDTNDAKNMLCNILDFAIELNLQPTLDWGIAMLKGEIKVSDSFLDHRLANIYEEHLKRLNSTCCCIL